MIEKKQIRTKDDRQITITCYSPEEANERIVIIGPAARLTQDEYLSFSLFLQSGGFTVITFDYRGVGASAPDELKGFIAGLQQWAVQDADAVIRYAKNKYPSRELIYIGHGIGGELIGLAPASQYIHRLILISSSLSCGKLFPLGGRIRIGVVQRFSKLVSLLFGYFPGKRLGMQGNLPKGVVNEWSSWCRNPNGLFDIFPESNYRKLQVPLLAISFSNEWLTPEKGVKELLNYFSGSSVTWHHIHPLQLGLKDRSYCFFEPALKDTLWKTLLSWLNRDEKNGIAGKQTGEVMTGD
jgi:predicted alpha/beta hydrolase